MMKKFFLPIAFLAVATVAKAQETQDSVVVEEEIVEVTPDTVSEKPYDRWSIEINGGVNKPIRPFTSGNYYTTTPSFFHVDLGVRYMFNPKFGLKLSGFYESFKNADESYEFESQMFGGSLEAVANLGRVLDFQDWTHSIGLLAHGGGGVSFLDSDDIDKADGMGHLIVGITPQLKLGNSIVLTGDVSGLITSKQTVAFDTKSTSQSGTFRDFRGFQGAMLTGSLGLTFYLGKNAVHADWYSEDDELEKRVSNIEEMLKDDDGDGVANYLDQEPNSAPNAVVDTKGRTIDSDGNGVPDVIEQYIKDNFGSNPDVLNDSNILKQLIDSGIINVYFDYDKSQPFNASVGGVDFVAEYLRLNPSASIDIIGYADPVGGNAYNQSLSQKRADAVKQILIGKGVDGSRLTASGKGIDAEFQKSAVSAHQLARRVVFKIK